MNGEKAAIVIPIYKNILSYYEKLALEQCIKILSNYPICVIKPAGLIISLITDKYPQLKVIEFEESFFESIQGYNRLMLSPRFYEAFVEYEFVLIYQLDAFVFKDDLAYWIDKDYDYIGAAWLWDYNYPDYFKRIKERVKRFVHIRWNVKQSNGLPSQKQFQDTVGNGGFSLRRIKKFLQLSIQHADLIRYYNEQDHHYYNEDSFWSIEINRKHRRLRIPSIKEATRFSIENLPERSIKLIENELPFGCHAWDKHLDFWRPYFKVRGYDI